MGWGAKLKKGFKKARKALGIPPVTLGNVAKVSAAAATGGIGAVAGGIALSKLKSAAIGGVKQAIRAKAQRAVVVRLKKTAPVPVLSRPTVVGINSRAQTMPGGAPLKGVVVAKRAKRSRTPKYEPGATDLKNKFPRPRKKAAAKPRKAPSGAKRSPPKGGKDLKALSASWKAAGKPGRWIDWVKSH